MKRWGKKKTYTIPGRTLEVRSGFEAKIGTELDKAGVAWSYEAESYPLSKALVGARCGDCGSKNVAKGARYTPDFTIPIPGSATLAIVEAKGRLTAKDRKTILAFSKVSLTKYNALYFVLLQRDNTLSKASKTRYSDWCAKNGITYAVSAAGMVPKEWYTSAP